MKKLIRISQVWVVLILVAACGPEEPAFDQAAYEAEIMQWREGRFAGLLAPGGYLTQVGLFWIGEGRWSIGSNADNDIVLPAGAAGRVGELQVSADGNRLVVDDGVEVLFGDEPVTELMMPPDVSGEIVMVQHGSIAWSVIERGGKLAVRVRDYEHPWLQTFGPIPYYDIEPELRVEAVLSRYAEPREIVVDTVIEGFQQYPVAVGTVSFIIDGERYELEPQVSSSGEQLFFVFGDLTNRDATYGAGRYLYADMPGDDGKFILDFNRAYSPPCAFNDFSTCPVASPRNRLPIRVEAGEKFDEALHFKGGGSY
jgi:uncharacterized protein (DUF1684 family)